MAIYVVCFILSIFCFNLSVKIEKKVFSYFFLIVSILLPSLLSGCRDDTVGTDLQLYGVSCWNHCSNMKTMSRIVEYSIFTNTEVGYVFFNYLIGKISKDIHIFLFFHQLIISSIFYIIAYRIKRNAYSNFVIVFYLLTLCVQSFNLLRQSMAIALVFLAFYLFFICKKKTWSVVITLFAMLFHNSIIFVVFLPFLYKLVKNGANKKIYIIAIMVTILIFLAFNSILMNLLSSGFLSNKYEHYASQVGYSSHKSDIALFSLVFFLLLYLKSKYKTLNYKNFHFIMVSTFIAICLLLLGDVTEVANRVAIYYTLPLFFIFSQIKLPRNAMKLLYYSFVSAMFAVWLYAASLGFSECVPYTSKILDVL